MDNIVNFPAKSVRDWLAIERTLKEVLAKGGAAPELQAAVIDKMKAFYDFIAAFDFSLSVNLSHPIPVSARDAVAELLESLRLALGERLKEFSNTLCVERINREIEANFRGV